MLWGLSGGVGDDSASFDGSLGDAFFGFKQGVLKRGRRRRRRQGNAAHAGRFGWGACQWFQVVIGGLQSAFGESVESLRAQGAERNQRPCGLAGRKSDPTFFPSARKFINPHLSTTIRKLLPSLRCFAPQRPP